MRLRSHASRTFGILALAATLISVLPGPSIHADRDATLSCERNSSALILRVRHMHKQKNSHVWMGSTASRIASKCVVYVQ